MPPRKSLRAAHRDGYRVRTTARELRLSIYICLVSGGKVVAKRRVWCKQENEPGNLIQHFPEWNRRAKLLASMVRVFNEGGSPDELGEAFLAADAFRGKHPAEIPFPAVAIESEETHVRTFLMDDGNYLRISEDEFVEELTPQEMAELAEACAQPDGVSFEP